MNERHNDAIVTLKHDSFGELDIRVSRDIPVKEIIHNLFDALSCGGRERVRGYCMRAELAQVVIHPYETLADKNVYDGDMLQIL